MYTSRSSPNFSNFLRRSSTLQAARGVGRGRGQRWRGPVRGSQAGTRVNENCVSHFAILTRQAEATYKSRPFIPHTHVMCKGMFRTRTDTLFRTPEEAGP